MAERPTPLVDAVSIKTRGMRWEDAYYVLDECARQLERDRSELAEALRTLMWATRDHIRTGRIRCDSCEADVEMADALLRRLEMGE